MSTWTRFSHRWSSGIVRSFRGQPVAVGYGREMADYIEAIFQAMGRMLGALHDTSYIVVHEIPAAAWGFAGKTQEFRFVAGRIKNPG
jgi:phenylpyruvate tautomerase PptA (4-oxalocrotonate tautomerase family)